MRQPYLSFIALGIVFMGLAASVRSNGTDKFHSIEIQNDSLKSIVEFLLNASANDFHDHQPPVPIRFRNVKVGYLIAPNAQKQYMLCGQFLSENKKEKDEWTPFATIKTSGYEQLIGGQALTYCQGSNVSWSKMQDLSSVLKSRMDALR